MTDTTAPAADLALDFLGAAGTVTGSRYLLQTGDRRVLVDCGLFQGYKPLRLRNRAPFPVDPASIDCVVLTHAHLDHAGYLPLLVRSGFRGPIHCTEATAALCRILLPDSGYLLEEEARYANLHGSSRHHPALPLYTRDDAVRSLRQLHALAFDQSFTTVPGMTVRFQRAGHILGAASAVIEHGGRRIVFSGDLGRPHDPVMHPPAPLPPCDTLVLESTYGDRRHPEGDPERELGEALSRVAARGGVAVVPAFAVGRAQGLLHMIAQLKARGALPRALPVYLNSPMATDTAALYQRFRGDHRLDDGACRALRDAATIVNSVEQSKALNRRHGPMVIVSASGMATGGRVVHHIQAFAPDPRNAIILSGHQVPGTRGASLVAGARTVRIFGEDVPVRAEVMQLRSASAHADSDELVAWVAACQPPPRQVFLTHGEPAAADALRQRLEHALGLQVAIPEHGTHVALQKIVDIAGPDRAEIPGNL